MKDFTMTIKSEDIMNEIVSLVNEGDKQNLLPRFVDIDYVSDEDLQDYLVDLKDVLVKKYLYDYYEDAIYTYLKKEGLSL